MKKLLLLLSLVSSLNASKNVVRAEPATETPPSIYLALSPFYSLPDRGTVRSEIPGLISSVPSKTRIVVIDGWNLKTIVEFEIPVLQLDKPSIRARFLREPLAKLLAWLERSAKETPPPELANTAALRIPECLQHITGQTLGTACSVVFAGSPLYRSLTEPTFSFLENRFPTDGHLACDPAGSVFGIKTKLGRLAGVTVHVWYPAEGIWSSEYYKYCVQRFVTLFVAGQSGVLASFNADGRRVLASASQMGLPPVGQYQIDPAMNKVEMLSISRGIGLRKLTNTVDTVDFSQITIGAPQEAKPRPGTEAEFLRTLDESVPAGQSAIGIMWSYPAMDLDLYVWATPDSSPLFYQQTSTPEGRYIHDYTAGNSHLDYEYVILYRELDLKRARVYVNIYSGSHSGAVVEGRVILRRGGKNYHGKFILRANSGNQGNELPDRESSRFWSEIILKDLTEAAPLAQQTQP